MFSLLFARIRLTEDTKRQILELANHNPNAEQQLLDTGLNVVGFACTSGSFIKGPQYDKTILKLIKKRCSKLKATPTSTAVLKDLKKLKLSVASSNQDWLNQRLKFFIESNGIKGLGATKNVAEIEDSELVEEACPPSGEDIFIRFTDLMTLHRVDRGLRLPFGETHDSAGLKKLGDVV